MSADQSSLDKQQIRFLVICFTVKYSDQLVTNRCAKSSRLLMPEGFGICLPVTVAL